MPLSILSILIPMVVLGIAGIAVLLHVLGLSRQRRFADEAEARHAWLDEFPTDAPKRLVLSHDHSAALIETDAGIGLVWPMGADSTARYLDGAEVRKTTNGLRIALPDYTAPSISLVLDAQEVGTWPALMEHAK